MQPRSTFRAEPGDSATRLPHRSFIALCGPAGAGKSTFAQSFLLHNGLPSTVAVSSDACRLALYDELSEMSPARWSQLQEQTFRLFLTIIDMRLSLARPTLADGVNLHLQLRLGLLASARKHDVRTMLVVFDLSLETCLTGNGQREAAHQVPVELIRSQRQALDQLLPHLADEGWDRVVVLNEQRRTAHLDLEGGMPLVDVDRPLRGG